MSLLPTGYTVNSNVLLQDTAFGLEKFLFTLFGLAVTWYEEFAFLRHMPSPRPWAGDRSVGRYYRRRAPHT